MNLQTNSTIDYYHPTEEKLNIISHAIGLIAGIFGFVLLLKKALSSTDLLYRACLITFGLSIIILYAASTLYHSVNKHKARRVLRIFDHIAIYLLIAGTYTPFTLLTLKYSHGILIFILCWSIAIFGILFKLIFTGRYDLFSTILYVVMGWLIVFDFSALRQALPQDGLYCLMMGGYWYTAGAVLYYFDQYRYNHAFFHLFVLLGTLFHFITVYYFVQ